MKSHSRGGCHIGVGHLVMLADGKEAQWASKEDFERMMKTPEAQARIRQFAAVARSVSPAVHQVSSVHTG